MRTNFRMLCFAAVIFLAACSQKQTADLLLYNGKVYTVDSAFSVAEAVAIRDGKILETGKSADLLARYDAAAKKDLAGKFVYPGFIDAHCHFYYYATMLMMADLSGTASFDDVLKKLSAFNPHSFPWILGLGWDQNDWPTHEYPTRDVLDSLYPRTPVFLRRIDGHAALCNKVALDAAGITASTKVDGGEVIVRNGEPTGVLIDNAMDLVKEKIPPYPDSLLRSALLKAQELCFAAGLTGVCDAGLGKDSILFIDQLQKEGALRMHVSAMLTAFDSTLAWFFRAGPMHTPHLNVRAIKMYADGSLGSRGACLLQPYSDQPGHSGFLLHDTAYMYDLARRAYEHGFQLCTHVIGDSAARVILRVYAEVLHGKNDKRWRIEHCQVMQPDEREKMGWYSVLPSVQPTHATSDMYWAVDRLGKDRIRYSYAWNDLYKATGHLAFGTDFPVENINPLYTFYAAVVRQDLKGYPPGGFEPLNAVSGRIALESMTRDAAFASFDEMERGSLEKGKAADLVILDTDLVQGDPRRVPDAVVLATYVGGRVAYAK